MLTCVILHTVIADIPIKLTFCFTYGYRCFGYMIYNTILDLCISYTDTVNISGITVLPSALREDKEKRRKTAG